MYQPGPPPPMYQIPSAHIEGGSPGAVDNPKDHTINSWNPNDPKSHMAGGFGYYDGKLRVPMAGRYYVYAQLYFCSKPAVNKNRVFLNSTHRTLLMINRDMQPGVENSTYTGGVFYLQPGEELFLKPSPYNARLYMAQNHCYFGAYMISPQ